MDTTQVQRYARQLYEVQGAKAIAEAAQKAQQFEHNNDREQAEIWRRIEAALILINGPSHS
jgi:dipeptidase